MGRLGFVVMGRLRLAVIERLLLQVIERLRLAVIERLLLQVIERLHPGVICPGVPGRVPPTGGGVNMGPYGPRGERGVPLTRGCTWGSHPPGGVAPGCVKWVVG